MKSILIKTWIFSFLFLSCLATGKKDSLLFEIRQSFKEHLLKPWYPRALDTQWGGFLSDFTADWKPEGPQNKAIVTQARHLWTISQAGMAFPNDAQYVHWARHGFRFLFERMWDSQYGGFFQLLNRKGEIDPNSEYGDEKRAYGNAFGIFACTAYYQFTKDTLGLSLAKKAFLWLDAHAHDPIYGGYFQNLKRDGTPIVQGDPFAKGFDLETAGLKDYNSSIHLLEAFTALYKIWPDSLLRTRLLEMFHLLRDVIVSPIGYLRLYFSPDWRPISYRDSIQTVRNAHLFLDHVTFGHDVETAYLLLEASHALGLGHDSTTLQIAKKMVDHAIRFGWDKEYGGLYAMGYYTTQSDTVLIVGTPKEWWIQAEALHAFLLMAKLFPEDPKYWTYFEKHWEYMKHYLIDTEKGGWYWAGLDRYPEFRLQPKGSEWKATYHEARALLNCIRWLSSKETIF